MKPVDATQFEIALNRAAMQAPDFETHLAQVPTNLRFETWHQTLRQAFYPFEMSRESDFGVGHLIMKNVGKLRAGLMRSDPVTAHRRRHQMSDRGGDFINLCMPIDTAVELEQRGRRAAIHPGDMGFVVTSDCYSYRQPQILRQLVLRIPTAAMRDRFPGIEDLSAQRLSREQAPVALFLDYASSFCANAFRFDPVSSDIAANYLLELFAFALSSSGDVESTRETSVKIAHMRRAVQFIEANLSDPDLDVKAISKGVNVSERYLQRLFAERGETITGFIRKRRVQDAKRLLTEPASRCQTIASIGYRVGFKDPSHFSRLFREVTGDSPRDYRSQ